MRTARVEVLWRSVRGDNLGRRTPTNPDPAPQRQPRRAIITDDLMPKALLLEGIVQGSVKIRLGQPIGRGWATQPVRSTRGCRPMDMRTIPNPN